MMNIKVENFWASVEAALIFVAFQDCFSELFPSSWIEGPVPKRPLGLKPLPPKPRMSRLVLSGFKIAKFAVPSIISLFIVADESEAALMAFWA